MSDRFEFQAIGTQWQIEIYQKINSQLSSRMLSLIHQRIDEFDKHYSRFRSDSLVTAMSLKSGTYTLPVDMSPMMSLYKRLYELTDGAFTPLIGRLLVEAGYDSHYSLVPGVLHPPQSWDVLSYKPPDLNLNEPVLLDVGAMGKGHLIDIVGSLLEKMKIYSFCIDAGGDILYKHDGTKKLRIGLEHPSNPQEVVGVVDILNQAICGSSGNRRRWKSFHHIIDPHTLSSPEKILATWVVADTTILADALATCLFLVPRKQLGTEFAFEYAIIRNDYSLERSTHFPGEFFTNPSPEKNLS